MEEERKFIVRADEIAGRARAFSHPWNPNSEMVGARLGALVGLSRIAVNWVSVPAGKESFIYHSHYREEEWIYIISGRGVAEIDGEKYEVAAGDFMGFPTPGVAHHLRNPSKEDLVYIVGGENLDVEIADFPRLGRRMIRRGGEVEIYDVSDAKSFGPPEDGSDPPGTTWPPEPSGQSYRTGSE